MPYRDREADSYWAELGGQADPAQESRPSHIDTCFICGQPGHFSVACRLHPARLRQIRGEACGPGPCTNACRSGDHGDCGFHWCRCACHEIPL